MTSPLKLTIGAILGCGLGLLALAAIALFDPGRHSTLALVLGFGLTWLGMWAVERREP